MNKSTNNKHKKEMDYEDAILSFLISKKIALADMPPMDEIDEPEDTPKEESDYQRKFKERLSQALTIYFSIINENEFQIH